MSEKERKSGRVFLIGAGPGDPDLITVKGYNILNFCDAVVYDNLIPHELIFTLPQNVEKIYVGKVADAHTLPQEQINELLVKLAKAGKNVVRLKGGDPFVFGRGGEEAEYLREHKIEFEVIPGITAGLAAAASAGIPASHRDMSSAILLITAHGSSQHDFFMDWEWVGAINNGTVIGYMGVRQLPNVVQNLIDNGLPPDTEAALVERCCFSTQKIVRAKLSELPQKAEEAGIKPPAIFIIGEVASLADKLDWFDRKPLSGIRVMVTRPADHNQNRLRERQRGLGGFLQDYR
jgi:uroporphyrinogen III methyltransferase/synthase